MSEKPKNLTREEVQERVQIHLDQRASTLRRRGVDYAWSVLRKISAGKFKTASDHEMQYHNTLAGEHKGIKVHLFFTLDFDYEAFKQMLSDAGYPHARIEGDDMWFGCTVIIPIIEVSS